MCKSNNGLWVHTAAIFVLVVVAQTAIALPMSFNINQSGFAGGGTVTGMFTGDDLNGDGVINSFSGELSAFMASWSGNATVAATTWAIGDLFGLVYELGTSDIGDDGACCGIEGLLATNAGGYTWNSGNGPGGFGALPGGGIQGPTGAVTTTSNLIQVTAKVPVPASAALILIGMVGAGFSRRKPFKTV